MSNPHVSLDRLDPDPLDAAEQEALRAAFFDRATLVVHHGDPDALYRAFNDGFDEAWAQRRPVLALVLAALSGALVGAALMWVVR